MFISPILQSSSCFYNLTFITFWTFKRWILSKVFLRERETFSSCFPLYGKLIMDVFIEQWLPSLGQLVVPVETFVLICLSPFVLLTIVDTYSFLQILFLGNATYILDGNPLNIMCRRDLSTLSMSLFSKYLAHVRTNLNKCPYLYFLRYTVVSNLLLLCLITEISRKEISPTFSNSYDNCKFEW